jgi:apolipoprotein N-acyltransferase
MTRALLGQGPLDLVVWAETAVDGDIDATPGLRERLTELVDGLGTPLVTGAARSSRGRPTNSVVLVAPGAGLLESYAKQRLVPFSEYDPPLAGILAPLLGPLMQGIPYEAGREPTVLRRGPIPLGAPVCFEITYPNLVRAFRMRGAELVLNLSNDAWFGRTGYPEMHLAHAVLRAVEFRTWVVRAANTGISAVVDPSGRVVDELPIFEPGTLTARVHPAGPPPLYARAGDGPVLLVLGAVLAAAATGRLRR